MMALAADFDREQRPVVRLVTSWATDPAQVDRFIAALS
jgi:threonine aldolase